MSKYKLIMTFDKLVESKAFRQGISFGVVSSAMTVLGMSFGMWSSASTLRNIIASIVGLSISNSLADGFSMYMANIARGDSKTQSIKSSSVTAVVEMIFPLVFLVPFFIFKEKTAIIFNAAIGMAMVALTGLYVSHLTKDTEKETLENLVLYLAVTMAIMACTYVGGKITAKIV